MTIERGGILAVVGPAGVGKGTSFDAIRDEYNGRVRVTPKITTRPGREGETDTIADISKEEFRAMVESGDVVMAHQPFGPEGHWYGYRREDLETDEPVLNLIEPNVEHQLDEFRTLFGGKALVVALTASKTYLAANLLHRGTDNPENIAKRLEAADRINAHIDIQREKGNIDEVVELHRGNRDQMAQMMIAMAGRVLQGELVQSGGSS